jgi:hypothetical protein
MNTVSAAGIGVETLSGGAGGAKSIEDNLTVSSSKWDSPLESAYILVYCMAVLSDWML